MSAAARSLEVPASAPKPGPDFLLGGIQVNEPSHRQWASALIDEGMNAVQVTVYARQADWDSGWLWSTGNERWVLSEVREARAAGLQVVLVLRLALDHWWENNRHLWHGMVMPRRDEEVRAWFENYREFVLHWACLAEREGIALVALGSELSQMSSTAPVAGLPELEAFYLNEEKRDENLRRLLRHECEIDPHLLRGSWDEPFEDFTTFLLDREEAYTEWARQVSFFDEADTVATLRRINGRRALLEERWVSLVEEVREVYSGRLTYAANFDQYRAVSFWSVFDCVGINAYFPLRQFPVEAGEISASYEEMVESWAAVWDDFEEFLETNGIPNHRAIFLELGYTSRLNSTLQPWAAGGFALVGEWHEPELLVWENRPEEPGERALAVRALHEALSNRPSRPLDGLLWWKLSTVPEHRRIEPFVLVIGPKAPADPLRDALRGFREWIPAREMERVAILERAGR